MNNVSANRTFYLENKFPASGQMEEFRGRKLFAREPTGFSARRHRRRAIRQVRFRLLDLWTKFGKIISKVCSCFNSEAKFVSDMLAPGVGLEPTANALH